MTAKDLTGLGDYVMRQYKKGLDRGCEITFHLNFDML